MKRIRIRVVLGWGLTLGVLLGNVGDIVYQNMSKPYVYASEYEEEVVEPKEVLIGTKIDWTRERIIKEIRDTFPEDPDTAVAIAKCESGLNPNAVGPTDDHGIFQLHAPSHGLEDIDVYDPKENIAFARKLYDERKWLPWVCYTHNMI